MIRFTFRLLLILIILPVGGFALGDETSFALGRVSQEQTFRRLLLPLGDSAIRNQLNIGDEQYQAYRNLLETNAFELPPFAGLVNSKKEREQYFKILEAKHSESDKPFADFWDEALLPVQSDALLAVELARSGLRAFGHPAMKYRLDISESQSEQLIQEIENSSEEARLIWGNLFVLPTKLPEKTQSAVQQALDLRSGKDVRVMAKLLTENQKQKLREVLARTPMQFQLRLTMGF